MDLDAPGEGVGSSAGFKEGGEVRNRGLAVVHGGVEGV